MYNTLSEILEKITLGEDSTIEFKERISHKDSLANEIAAFANTKGGVILIGIGDNKEIIGISENELESFEKIVIEICRDSIEPTVNIYTEKLLIENKNILKIEVSRSLFVHKSPHGYFRRQGSSKRVMPTDQLARLMQSRSQARIISFDEQAVPNTDVNTLNQSLYMKFIPNKDDKIKSLYKRQLLRKENGSYCASVAGVLMCCDTPTEHLYHSFIQAVHYREKIRDANYQIDAKDFKNTLDRQIIEAFKFVERYNQVSAIKIVGREERPQYSMKAVFEAIVNAVVHRDYSKHSSHIRLFMFSDRLEIYSPGALANTLTIENLSDNLATRNELLSRLLSEITLDDNINKTANRRYFLERRGEGVGIILNESEQLSGKKPIYEMLGEELKLTIFAAQSLQDNSSQV